MDLSNGRRLTFRLAERARRYNARVSADSDPVIEACRRDVDRTLIRENLIRQQRAADEMREARPRDLDLIAELEAIGDETGG